MLTKIDVKELPSYNWGLQDGKLEGKLEARREGIIEGRREGLIEGRREGILEGKLEVYTDVAIKLLPMMDDDKIAHVTSLPIEQIRALRESNTGD